MSARDLECEALNSMTSGWAGEELGPGNMSRQLGHSPQGLPSLSIWLQLSAAAMIRAVEVLPHPC